MAVKGGGEMEVADSFSTLGDDKDITLDGVSKRQGIRRGSVGAVSVSASNSLIFPLALCEIQQRWGEDSLFCPFQTAGLC
jgi:hypothetical protein